MKASGSSHSRRWRCPAPHQGGAGGGDAPVSAGAVHEPASAGRGPDRPDPGTVLRQETLGDEGVGLLPQPAVAVEHVGGDRHQRAAPGLEALPRTKAALEEAMRLFPPVPFMSRQALAEDKAASISASTASRAVSSCDRQ
jgi:hypothetical protein